uniref:C2H2-type domain-containing protein n=1 Tax=Panagrellus redivivus TaxID=6233 RepID=A0A7E4VAG7_PANRE
MPAYQQPQPGASNPMPAYQQPQPVASNPMPVYQQPQPGASNPMPGYQQLQPGASNPMPAYQQPQPGASNPMPGYQQLQPGASNQMPAYQQPQSGASNPMPGYQQPQPGASNPVPVYQQPQSGASNPMPGYQQPQPGASNPMPGYQQLQPGASNPMPGYQQPQPGASNAVAVYQQPQPGASNPVPVYQQPQPGALNPMPAYQQPQPVASNALVVYRQPQPGASNPMPAYQQPQPVASNAVAVYRQSQPVALDTGSDVNGALSMWPLTNATTSFPTQLLNIAPEQMFQLICQVGVANTVHGAIAESLVAIINQQPQSVASYYMALLNQILPGIANGMQSIPASQAPAVNQQPQPVPSNSMPVVIPVQPDIPAVNHQQQLQPVASNPVPLMNSVQRGVADVLQPPSAPQAPAVNQHRQPVVSNPEVRGTFEQLQTSTVAPRQFPVVDEIRTDPILPNGSHVSAQLPVASVSSQSLQTVNGLPRTEPVENHTEQSTITVSQPLPVNGTASAVQPPTIPSTQQVADEQSSTSASSNQQPVANAESELASAAATKQSLNPLDGNPNAAQGTARLRKPRVNRSNAMPSAVPFPFEEMGMDVVEVDTTHPSSTDPQQVAVNQAAPAPPLQPVPSSTETPESPGRRQAPIAGTGNELFEMRSMAPPLSVNGTESAIQQPDAIQPSNQQVDDNQSSLPGSSNERLIANASDPAYAATMRQLMTKISQHSQPNFSGNGEANNDLQSNASNLPNDMQFPISSLDTERTVNENGTTPPLPTMPPAQQMNPVLPLIPSVNRTHSVDTALESGNPSETLTTDQPSGQQITPPRIETRAALKALLTSKGNKEPQPTAENPKKPAVPKRKRAPLAAKGRGRVSKTPRQKVASSNPSSTDPSVSAPPKRGRKKRLPSGSPEPVVPFVYVSSESSLASSRESSRAPRYNTESEDENNQDVQIVEPVFAQPLRNVDGLPSTEPVENETAPPTISGTIQKEAVLPNAVAEPDPAPPPLKKRGRAPKVAKPKVASADPLSTTAPSHPGPSKTRQRPAMRVQPPPPTRMCTRSTTKGLMSKASTEQATPEVLPPAVDPIQPPTATQTRTSFAAKSVRIPLSNSSDTATREPTASSTSRVEPVVSPPTQPIENQIPQPAPIEMGTRSVDTDLPTDEPSAPPQQPVTPIQPASTSSSSVTVAPDSAPPPPKKRGKLSKKPQAAGDKPAQKRRVRVHKTVQPTLPTVNPSSMMPVPAHPEPPDEPSATSQQIVTPIQPASTVPSSVAVAPDSAPPPPKKRSGASKTAQPALTSADTSSIPDAEPTEPPALPSQPVTSVPPPTLPINTDGTKQPTVGAIQSKPTTHMLTRSSGKIVTAHYFDGELLSSRKPPKPSKAKQPELIAADPLPISAPEPTTEPSATPQEQPVTPVQPTPTILPSVTVTPDSVPPPPKTLDSSSKTTQAAILLATVTPPVNEAVPTPSQPSATPTAQVRTPSAAEELLSSASTDQATPGAIQPTVERMELQPPTRMSTPSATTGTLAPTMNDAPEDELPVEQPSVSPQPSETSITPARNARKRSATTMLLSSSSTEVTTSETTEPTVNPILPPPAVQPASTSSSNVTVAPDSAPPPPKKRGKPSKNPQAAGDKPAPKKHARVYKTVQPTLASENPSSIPTPIQPEPSNEASATGQQPVAPIQPTPTIQPAVASTPDSVQPQQKKRGRPFKNPQAAKPTVTPAVNDSEAIEATVQPIPPPARKRRQPAAKKLQASTSTSSNTTGDALPEGQSSTAPQPAVNSDEPAAVNDVVPSGRKRRQPAAKKNPQNLKRKSAATDPPAGTGPVKRARRQLPVRRLERIPTPVRRVERVPTPVRQLERIPTPVRQLERIPTPVRQLERIPTPVRQLERIPTPVRQLERIPTPVQQLERIPTPVRQLERIPTPVRQLERIPTPVRQVPE